MNLFAAYPFLNEPVKTPLGADKSGDFPDGEARRVWQILVDAPTRYRDTRNLKRLCDAIEGEEMVFFARLENYKLYEGGRIGAEVRDGLTVATLFWAKAVQYLLKRLEGAKYLVVSGRPGRSGDTLWFNQPEFWPAPDFERQGRQGPSERETRENEHLGINPVYGTAPGLSHALRREILDDALTQAKHAPPLFPGEILQRHGLAQPFELLATVHYPPRWAKGRLPMPEDTQAWKSLTTLELAFWRLIVFLSRGTADQRGRVPAPTPKWALDGVERMWGWLPFKPSPEQRRVTKEILADLAVPNRPMRRLLHGEIGSGKSMVAAAAAVAEIGLDRQVAMIVPNDTLASRYLAFFSRLGEAMGFDVHYLGGIGYAGVDHPTVSGKLAEGRPSITIGTSAEPFITARFKDLSLTIIDERGRCGSRQFLGMIDKSPRTSLLCLTAAPMDPALTDILYGDMGVSSLKGLLPGRSVAKTIVCDQAGAALAREFMARLVQEGRQAFVLIPIGDAKKDDPFVSVDGTEGGQGRDARTEVTGAFEGIRALLPKLEVVHFPGQPRGKAWTAALDNFRDGKTRALVCTDTVSSWLDAPPTDVMLIEGADRLNLSLLHQLRGMVGRGGSQGYLFLVSGEAPSKLGRSRLEAIVAHHDVYRLSELDMTLRAHPDQLKFPFAAHPAFFFAKFPRDLPLLPSAFDLAQDLWGNQDRWGPELNKALSLAKVEILHGKQTIPLRWTNPTYLSR
ncbi:MAG: hypothetical protein LBF58_06430 [Deltaproteobacteria bacterium]|jgi:ATP-dependent DNA helicase RecG|nr:hypothetical protein [Deltaproteobacteria bacterium]